MEDAAGAFTLQVQLMLSVFLLLGLTIFMINHTQTIDFKNYVDGQAEKNGGLTENAMTNINSYSEAHYGGRYEVVSLSGNEKKSYGESIDYEIRGNIQILFFDIPDQLTRTRGSTISYVR